MTSQKRTGCPLAVDPYDPKIHSSKAEELMESSLPLDAETNSENCRLQKRDSWAWIKRPRETQLHQDRVPRKIKHGCRMMDDCAGHSSFKRHTTMTTRDMKTQKTNPRMTTLHAESCSQEAPDNKPSWRNISRQEVLVGDRSSLVFPKR